MDPSTEQLSRDARVRDHLDLSAAKDPIPVRAHHMRQPTLSRQLTDSGPRDTHQLGRVGTGQPIRRLPILILDLTGTHPPPCGQFLDLSPFELPRSMWAMTLKQTTRNQALHRRRRAAQNLRGLTMRNPFAGRKHALNPSEPPASRSEVIHSSGAATGLGRSKLMLATKGQLRSPFGSQLVGNSNRDRLSLGRYWHGLGTKTRACGRSLGNASRCSRADSRRGWSHHARLRRGEDRPPATRQEPGTWADRVEGVTYGRVSATSPRATRHQTTLTQRHRALIGR